MTVTAAYPYVEVRVVPPPPPVVQRSPGVIAVVGKSNAGSAADNVPVRVDSLSDARTLVGDTSALYQSLEAAFLQQPRASKVYAVKVGGENYAAALAGLEAADDVTMVSLAGETDVGTGGATPTKLQALKKHVETMDAGGQRMIAFAMVDPATAKSPTYVADVADKVKNLASSRMVLVAARGAASDAATATMAAVAGLPVHHSVVLKPVRGVSIPVEQQYSPAEVKGLAERKIIPLIDPTLISGESVHLADGWLFGPEDRHVDLLRTMDDAEARLRAGLIGLVGDARITKPGLTLLRTVIDGILETMRRQQVIDAYSIEIPVLDLLRIPEAARVQADKDAIRTARDARAVDVAVVVTYGPALSRLLLTLKIEH